MSRLRLLVPPGLILTDLPVFRTLLLVLVLFLLVKDFRSLVTHKLILGVHLLLGSVLLLFGVVLLRHLVSLGSRLLSVSVLKLSRAMLPPSLPFILCLPLQEVDHVSVPSLPLSCSLWE